MTAVTSTWAKAHFSEILDRIEGGEDFEITRNGDPVAVLIRCATPYVTKAISASEYILRDPTGLSDPSDPIPTGVMQPAPGAANLFRASEPVNLPARITQEPRSAPATGEGSPKPASAPQKPAKGALTLADILKASGQA